MHVRTDVVEPNPDPSGQTTGGTLIVDGKYEFTDLDEMIVNHVQALARRVEELMNHEKFKSGPEDELRMFTRPLCRCKVNLYYRLVPQESSGREPCEERVRFHPEPKEARAFQPMLLSEQKLYSADMGKLHLLFPAYQALLKMCCQPVRVAPEAYFLFDTPATGVSELCDAFKLRQMHESQTHGAGGAGGKTPYGGRTPGRTPAIAGMATPGHMSVRQSVGRTPNPYAGGATPAPNGGGFRPPAPPTLYGGLVPGGATPFGQPPSSMPPPSMPPPGMAPPGMNPQRAQMIQQAGGWGTTPTRPAW
jgi:transcription elongation factor SPT6